MHTSDLHIHSCYSDDGEYTPAQLVHLCCEAGVEQMAIADHNCIKGVAEAMMQGKQLAVEVIPAIEIDCIYQDAEFHLLGYGIDITADDFIRIEENIRSQGKKASAIRLQKIRDLGFDIREEDLQKITAGSFWPEQFTGEVFAQVLLTDGRYTNNPMLAPYRQNGVRGDNPYVNFYWDYFSQNMLCYSPVQYPLMEKIIAVIHQNGGKAVLAHPGNNLKGHFEWIDQMISLGLDGIEAFSSYHNEPIARYFYEKTKEYNLIATGGSDFHGKTKPSIRLGQYIRLDG